MKVKLTGTHRVVDKDGKVHTSGTIDMADSEAKAALAAGYVEKVKPPKSKKVSEPGSSEGGPKHKKAPEPESSDK